jgi:hypothetical protein
MGSDERCQLVQVRLWAMASRCGRSAVVRQIGTFLGYLLTVKRVVKHWCGVLPAADRRTVLVVTGKEAIMTLFMDVHTIEGGVSEADVAGAHRADLAAQGTHGVNYLRYWVDERAGKIFCLVEAPDADAAHAVHREAHGLVADEIYPVHEHS